MYKSHIYTLNGTTSLDRFVNTEYTRNMSSKKQVDDPAMEKVRSIFRKSGLSLAELGKRMGYDDETARQSAWQFMQSRDPRMSMLRKFSEAMGISLEELGRKEKRMARRLETELRECGCEMDPKMFRDVVVERHGQMHGSWTEDDLVCHPDEAKTFCQAIRSEVGAEVPDHIILRTLLNARKAH